MKLKMEPEPVKNVGLTNKGSYCYMNALLQAFNPLGRFRRFIDALKDQFKKDSKSGAREKYDDDLDQNERTILFLINAFNKTRSTKIEMEWLEIFFDDNAKKRFRGETGDQDPISLFEFLMKEIDRYLKRKKREYYAQNFELSQDSIWLLAHLDWINPFTKKSIFVREDGNEDSEMYENFYYIFVQSNHKNPPYLSEVVNTELFREWNQSLRDWRESIQATIDDLNASLLGNLTEKGKNDLKVQINFLNGIKNLGDDLGKLNSQYLLI